MSYYDFVPHPPIGINTNGGAVLLRLIDNSDSSLITQSASSVIQMSAIGQGFFNAVSEAVNGPDKEILVSEETNLRSVVSGLIIPNITKPFDATFKMKVEKEKTITIEVPKERKVGLFKKETYIEHETKTEKYFEDEEVTYKGWRIERLSRKEIYSPTSFDELFIDYFLGADGEFYTALYTNRDPKPVFYKAIYFSPFKLSNQYCNVYLSAFSGVVGALDAIPIDSAHPQRDNHLILDNEYVFNFPIQLNSMEEYPYKLYNGALYRCIELLDEGEVKNKLRAVINS